MTLEKRIQLCNELTPAEQQLANYILKNRSQLETVTISQLAQLTFLSISSIHRFCKKLGLQGFKELKLELLRPDPSSLFPKINVNFPFTAKDSCSVVAQSLQQLYVQTISDTCSFLNYDRIKKIAVQAASSSFIDIYTHAHNSYPAGVLADRLLTIGKTVRCPEDFYTQRNTALSSDSTHISILISFSGRAYFLPSVLKILKKKKVKLF